MKKNIFIGIGSNLGDKEKNLKEALVYLNKHDKIKLVKSSSFYNTKPFGNEDQPDFINMACEIKTLLEPEQLLELLKNIENIMGRVETIRWGSRIIDLDILFFGNLILDTKNLIIPHLGICERKFVLEPLSEIAPNFVHPIEKKRINVILEEVMKSEKNSIKFAKEKRK